MLDTIGIWLIASAALFWAALNHVRMRRLRNRVAYEILELRKEMCRL